MKTKRIGALKLSRLIARDLMTCNLGMSGCEITGDRMALKLKQPDGTEKDLGGRCTGSMECTIRERLIKEGVAK